MFLANLVIWDRRDSFECILAGNARVKRVGVMQSNPGANVRTRIELRPREARPEDSSIYNIYFLFLNK